MNGVWLDKALIFVKALAGAIASFVAVVLWAWSDRNVSLDEINELWLAVVPVLTALGIAIAPKNREPSSPTRRS